MWRRDRAGPEAGTVTDGERIDPDDRPTAEEMLARIGGAAGERARGRLRVYLGMAPGVGKTFRMLEEGHRRSARGTDLVVGFVEAHGRPETEKLLAGLEIVPRRRVEHRGVAIEEMDTDAVVARAPTVALVDELAHTNAPGSARSKRWEDVQVLLDAGIDVVSTCNIQHLDSVADAVATITGAPVNERIPDEVLAAADEVELVDMSPFALRQRMRHGNVYPPERTMIALERFFTESNLTALRELSLRFVAGRVDAQLEGIGTPIISQPVTERVLVLVDGSAAAPRAIRRAAAAAAVLRAPLLAVVVDTPGDAGASSEQVRRLREDLDDAVDLGAEVLNVEAADLADGIVELARRRRVTRIVLPYRPSSTLERLRTRPLAERILERLPALEITMVAESKGSTDAYRVGRGD
jgi:two-component system, OmpR family, sensor histidine kinase KdpD